MKQKNTATTADQYDISTYRRLRKSIGYLGAGLPFVLITCTQIPVFETTVQGSISHFYYTNLREIFTGTLCAVGLFLILYKGHTNKHLLKNDRLLTNIAGMMAFGIAFFPTNPNVPGLKIYSLIPNELSWLGYLHIAFAAVFFLILANISINVFTIGQNRDAEIPISVYNENNIYRICGYLILLFIVLMPICDYLQFQFTTLIFEAGSLLAFGISWLIKGRALGDSGKIGENLYREKN